MNRKVRFIEKEFELKTYQYELMDINDNIHKTPILAEFICEHTYKRDGRVVIKNYYDAPIDVMASAIFMESNDNGAIRMEHIIKITSIIIDIKKVKRTVREEI